MRYILRIFLGITLFLSASTALHSQEIVLDTDTLTIYFRINRHDFDPSYMGNKERMEEFLEYLEKANSSSSTYLGLDFNVTSSPEGRYEFNKKLSQQRAESIEKYLREHSTLSDQVLDVFHMAEAWDELGHIVRSSDRPWKEDVLDIIETYDQTATDEKGNLIEPRKQKLKAYDKGRPWGYMLDHWFPKLRQFSVVIRVCIHAPVLDFDDIEIEEVDVPFEELVVDDTRPVVSLMPTWRPEYTVKTNTIGWGMGHTNVAAEVDLAPHWSIAVPFYYSGGVDYFKSTLKFRGIVLQPEARYYFKDNDGWYIGAHLGMGWYNFALNGDYRIQDHKGTRPAWGGGIGAGYSLQFKRFHRWGMEFSVGAGVYDVKYDMFYNEPNGPYAEVGVHDTFFGIDNVAVTFTYKFLKGRKEGKL